MKRWITVKLLGELGRRFVRELKLFISTPREALKLIQLNFPEFESYVLSSEARGAVYRVISGSPIGRDEEELEFPCAETLIIAELDQGAGALGKTLLGVALLGASFFMPATISLFGATFSSFAVGALGASLILGGISEMVAPKAKNSSDPKNANSNAFGGTGTSASQLQPVPLFYGFGLMSNPPLVSQGVTVARLSV